MEHKLRVLPPETLMELLPDLLDEAEFVPLVISGGSMMPFLVNGRDTVYLSRVTRPLKRGDMILYRRDNGAYVLHRIYRVEPEDFCLVGDAQTVTEKGIRPEQVLAVVSAVGRKGKILRPGSFWWDFFEKIWIRLLPLRRGIMAAYSGLTGLPDDRESCR